jgi:sugar lactone lactonase YvrE
MQLMAVAVWLIGVGLGLAAGSPKPAPTPAPTPTPAPRTALEFAQAGDRAYRANDLAAFLRDYEEAVRRRPGDTRLLYNLACAQSRNGQTAAALATLGDLAKRRTSFDLTADTDFDPIRREKGFADVVAKMAAVKDERITSGAIPAFTIAEKELAPEGVAYDPVTKAFFVASVRKGKIVRIGPDGKITDFVPRGSGLRSALGIGVDAKRRSLWVANEAIPLMNGATDADRDRPDSALFEFDLDTGRLRGKHVPPASPNPPHFDDLSVAVDGRVYVNDGFNPRIYVFDPRRDSSGAFELWLESGGIDGGTQGLAATRDGRALYLSDYRGLYRVDTATKRVTPIPVPADVSLNGVDGLVLFGNSLIVIQNGVVPHRVTRLDLAPDGVGVVRARILEMNHPAFDEPTLGTVADGTLYFTANNQGHRYYDTKHPYKPEDLQDAVILKLPLRPSP